MTFLVAGESLVDIVVPAGGADEDRHEAVGGSCLNVAVGLARLDVPTTLFTRLGDDEHGHRILEHLEASGVTVAAGSSVAGVRTSTATATLDDQRLTVEPSASRTSPCRQRSSRSATS